VLEQQLDLLAIDTVTSPYDVKDPSETNFETVHRYPRIRSSRVNFWMNIAVATSFIQRIEVHYPDGVRDLPRHNLHVLLSASKGSLKSTRLRQMRVCYPDRVILKDAVSYAALVGSIDSDTKDSNVPLAIRARGKVLAFDEMIRDREGHFTKALLQLLEDGEYSRDVAITPNNRKNILNSYWSVENGEIKVQSHFSAVIATMQSPGMMSRTQLGGALLDRVVVLWHYTDYEETKDYFTSSKPLYRDLGFKPAPEVVVSEADYLQIFNFWLEHDPTFECKRKLGDMIRTFAVLGRHDETVYKELLALGRVEELHVQRRRH